MKKSLLWTALFFFGVFLISASQLNAEKKWTWFIQSSHYSPGSPGTFDLTIGLKANSPTWVGRLGTSELEGEMNIVTLYDFDLGANPFLFDTHLSGDYYMSVDDPEGDREWNLEINYYGVPGVGDQVTEVGVPVATIRFFVKEEGGPGILLGVPDYQQTYEDNGTLVDSVAYDSTGGNSLPVQMSSLTAFASAESGITVIWETQSEVNCAGFHVWRSLEDTEGYLRLTPSLIPGKGNSSTAQEYSFTDRNIESDVLYWYQVEEVSMFGQSIFFGPISVMGIDLVPDDFGLSQNYPNPFNSDTWFEYQLPEACEVRIAVFDLLGKEIKPIVKGKQPGGFHSSHWDGNNNEGKPVPSGIYLLYLKTDQVARITRMTVLR